MLKNHSCYICYHPQKENMEIRGVYCQNDGGIDGVGKILLDYYTPNNDPKSIDKIIHKILYVVLNGDMLYLGKIVKECERFPEQDGARDCRFFNTIEDLINDANKNMVNFVYLYMSRENKWVVYDIFNRAKKIDLETALREYFTDIYPNPKDTLKSLLLSNENLTKYDYFTIKMLEEKYRKQLSTNDYKQ